MTSGPLFLGIDIGGAGVKTGLFTATGVLVASGYREYPMSSRVPGEAEQDAEDWWRCSAAAIRDTVSGVSPAEVAAVGVGCTNGLVAVDGAGRPLRPAVMLWDQRCLPEVERIREVLGDERVFAVTGNPLAPGAYSLPTLLWLRRHEPETFAAAHKLMVPGGYLVARLSGEFTVDFSRASTTLLFDVRRRQWHEPFLEALEVPLEKLPRPCPSDDVVGTVTAEAARETGLARGTPVLAGCMDTVGASLGSGVLEAGEAFVIMGTAARVSAPLDEPRFDRRFMNCTHVRPDLWLAIGALNGVGSSLRWVRDTLGREEIEAARSTGQDAFDLLTGVAAQAPAGAKGLVYLPYLAGERTPIWDPHARGVLFGLTLSHGRAEIFRAVLEGTCFAIRQCLAILREVEGLDPRELKVGGAAARSEVWIQILADVLGLPVRACQETHTEVSGAALLAAVAVGAADSYAEAFPAWVDRGVLFEPHEEARRVYDEVFPLYESLYPALRPFFGELAALDTRT